jgi:hypothetical protein
MVLHLLLGAASQRTGVTGVGAGVDSTWEQEKLEARKIIVIRAGVDLRLYCARIFQNYAPFIITL